MVSVQDQARLHLAALVDPDVKNERLYALAYPFSINQILEIWRKRYPKNSKLPPSRPDFGHLSPINPDSSRSLEVLKKNFGQKEWMGLEETIVEQVEALPSVSPSNT